MIEFPKPGEIFSQRYELLEVLGSGGIGTVFKALQLESRRIIALKVMHPEFAEDEEFKSRFLREARALSQLNHPGVVTVFHIGLSEAGLSYIAMELICGVSLRRVLNQENSLSARRAIGIARQLAEALSYVHEHGIVHRDIKPENIILLDKPEPDTVKLIDFGLARIETEQKLTQTGILIGSVNYMSPEQCQGKKADQRSDIYSLAICLFEMLTGGRPFWADTPIGLMYKQINEPIPAIEKDKVDRFVPEINAILSKAAAKSAGDRYQSMKELINELDSLKENRPGIESSRYRIILRKKLRSIAAALALLVSVAAGAFLLPKLVSYFGFQKARLAGNSILKNNSESARRRRWLEELSTEVKRKEARYRKAKSPAEQSDAGEKLFLSLRSLSENQMDFGRYHDAENSLKQELLVCQSIKHSSEQLEATVWNDLARCKLAQGDLREAESLVNSARTCKFDSLETEADLAQTRSLLYMRAHRFKEADHDFKVMEKILLVRNPESDPKIRFTKLTEEPYYAKCAWELFLTLSREKLNGNEELIDALNLMNDIDFVLLKASRMPRSEPFDFSLNLLKRISPDAPNYQTAAHNTYQLLSRFETDFNHNPNLGAEYLRQAELLKVD